MLKGKIIFLLLILILFDNIYSQNYIFSRTFWPKNNYDPNAIPSCTDYIDLKITIQDGSNMAIFNIETNRLNSWIGIGLPNDRQTGPYFDTTQNKMEGYSIVIERLNGITVNEYTCFVDNCFIQFRQGLIDTNVTEINNILYVSFMREMVSDDRRDFQLKLPFRYLQPMCNPLLVTAAFGMSNQLGLSGTVNHDWVHSFLYMYDENILNNGVSFCK